MYINKSDKYNYYTSENEAFLTSEYKINRINSMLQKKREELEELKYVIKLYESERISVIKNEVSYWWFNPSYIEKINKWLEISKTKYDKRRKYEEKDSFDYIQNTISNELFCKKPINIFKTMVGGYENYTDIIIFTCEDMEFQLSIPNFKYIHRNNFEYADEGKISIYVRTSKCSLSRIAEGYDETIISKQIEAFFNNEEEIKEIKSKYNIKNA